MTIQPVNHSPSPEMHPSTGGESGVGACPRCHGMRFIYIIPSGKREWEGHLEKCQCQSQVTISTAEARLQQASGLIGDLRKRSLANYKPMGDSQRAAHRAAAAFAQHPDGWLFLVGSSGCGKTHLAAAIANARISRMDRALLVVVPDLLDHLRSAFKPGSEIAYDERFEEIRQHPLLILDDLGAENDTEWANEKLFQIINYRYNAHLPTVFTSNLVLAGLPPRIKARIQDSAICTIIRVDRDGIIQGRGKGQAAQAVEQAAEQAAAKMRF